MSGPLPGPMVHLQIAPAGPLGPSIRHLRTSRPPVQRNPTPRILPTNGTSRGLSAVGRSRTPPLRGVGRVRTFKPSSIAVFISNFLSFIPRRLLGHGSKPRKPPKKGHPTPTSWKPADMNSCPNVPTAASPPICPLCLLNGRLNATTALRTSLPTAPSLPGRSLPWASGGPTRRRCGWSMTPTSSSTMSPVFRLLPRAVPAFLRLPRVGVVCGVFSALAPVAAMSAISSRPGLKCTTRTATV